MLWLKTSSPLTLFERVWLLASLQGSAIILIIGCKQRRTVFEPCVIVFLYGEITFHTTSLVVAFTAPAHEPNEFGWVAIIVERAAELKPFSRRQVFEQFTKRGVPLLQSLDSYKTVADNNQF